MVNGVLGQISRDQYVLRNFVVPTLSALQVVKSGTNHLLKFEEDIHISYGSLGGIVSSLDLSEVFAITHGNSRDSLQLFASLRVDSGRHSIFDCNPVKDGETHPKNRPEVLRLGVYEFRIREMAEMGANTEAFLALYEQLAGIIDAQNNERGMPKRLLIFVNPHSGENMRACRVFARYVSPLFKLVSINLNVIVLTAPSNPLRLDAENLGRKWSLPADAVELVFENPTEYCQRNNVEDYDGVLTISGDGTLSDMMLGVVKRRQGENNEITPKINLQRFTKPVFGVIPAGSTDALALTIYGNNDPLTAVLNVISGRRVGMDVQGLFDAPAGFSPDNKDYSLEGARLCRFCFTGVGGAGFVPKVVVYGRRARPIFRSQRFNAAGVPIFIANKPISLAVYYKSATTQPNARQPICGINCQHCANFNNQSPCNMSLVAGEQPWSRNTQSKFFGVQIASNAVLSRYQATGLAPHSHLGDGTADIVLLKHQPTAFHYLCLIHRAQTLSDNMYDMAKDGLEFVRITEYSLEPLETADRRGGDKSNLVDEPKLLCSSDGELFHCRRLLGIVYCQLFQMYGCGRPISTTS